jgi:hypothetical protein
VGMEIDHRVRRLRVAAGWSASVRASGSVARRDAGPPELVDARS